MKKIITPDEALVLPKALNRRTFLRRAGRGGIGAILAAGVAPQLFLNPVYAGTAVIMSSSTDKRVELSNASFARGFDLGTWTTMRVVVRLMMEGASSLTSLTPRFVVGICSGSANQVFDATTDNFVGIRTVSATWTLTAAVPDRWANGSGQKVATKRVGSTWTDSSAFAGQWYFFRASEAAGDNVLLIVEIAKGSPNYTLAMLSASTTTFANVTEDTMMAQAVAVTPALAQHTWTSGITIAADESGGTFDHVQIGWDRSEATVQISDIVLVKMA